MTGKGTGNCARCFAPRLAEILPEADLLGYFDEQCRTTDALGFERILAGRGFDLDLWLLASICFRYSRLRHSNSFGGLSLAAIRTVLGTLYSSQTAVALEHAAVVCHGVVDTIDDAPDVDAFLGALFRS